MSYIGDSAKMHPKFEAELQAHVDAGRLTEKHVALVKKRFCNYPFTGLHLYREMLGVKEPQRTGTLNESAGRSS